MRLFRFNLIGSHSQHFKIEYLYFAHKVIEPLDQCVVLRMHLEQVELKQLKNAVLKKIQELRSIVGVAFRVDLL